MKLPRVAQAPERIFLQVGDLDADVVFSDLELSEISWCSESIYDTDIEYRRIRTKPHKRAKKMALDAERQIDFIEPD